MLPGSLRGIRTEFFIGEIAGLALQLVSFPPGRFQIKYEVLHIQPQLADRFLDHLKDFSATIRAFENPLKQRLQEEFGLGRKSVDRLLHLGEFRGEFQGGKFRNSRFRVHFNAFNTIQREEGKVRLVARRPEHVGLNGHGCNGDVCNGQGQHLKKTQVVRCGCRRLIVDGLECFVNPY